MIKTKNGLAPLIALGLLALAVVGVFSLVNMFSGGDSPLAAVGGTPSSGATDFSGCQIEDTTVTVRGFDVENKGTSVTGTHSLWVDGVSIGTVANAGTATLSPGDTLDVLFEGNNTEIDEGFYAKHVTGITVPCSGTLQLSEYLQDKPSANASMTFLNSDDDAANSGTDAQAVGSGGEETGTLKLQSASEDYYGNDKVLIVLEGTSSIYDSLEVIGGKKMSPPSQFTIGSTANEAWAYEVDGLVGAKRVSYDVTIKATDGQNPTTAHNITVTLFDKSLFVDADSNAVESGYEDELNNEVGYFNPSSTISIS